jgi:alpha-galactosidase
MISILKSVTISLLLTFFAIHSEANLLSVEVKTTSNNSKITTHQTISNWGKNTKLVSISMTNQGQKSEIIKEISIRIKNSPKFNQNTKFLYGSYEMSSKTPIQQRGFNDEQLFTESILMAKLGENKFYKVGILTWEIFRASIAFSKENGIEIKADGEDKPIKAGETLLFEKLVLEEGTDWQDMMFSYGKQIAETHNIKPKEIGKWNGYGTWDYFGHDFTYVDVKSNMELTKSLYPEANIMQLDASWWINRGDYLETRSNLPGGMKGIAKMINDYGMVAGLHLDGMRAVSTSKVFNQHPDWFLKDQDGKTIYAPLREQQRVFFDYSNPAVCDYMRNVLKTMTTDWGYKYIKVDFLCFGLNRDIFSIVKDTTVKKIVAFDTTMTSMERSRAGQKAMREGIGEAYFLGCSSVFGPNFGLIDALRTGPDINPRYDSYRSHVLQNAGNFYLNQTVVQNDADYIVVRSKEDEDASRAQGKNKFGGDVSLNEAAMWANYVALFGGIKLSSDDLNLLRPERKELVKKAFSMKTCQKFIPIDLWDKAKDNDDAFNVMLGTNEQGVYLALFNWKDEELGINLSNFETENIEVINKEEHQNYIFQNNSLIIQLAGRSSVIFKLGKDANFDEVRKKLSYKFSH